MAKRITSLQFKVTLLRVRPPIWRRILVPADYSFWDLHIAIQDAMGWQDCHLHEFVVRRGKRELRIGNGGQWGEVDDVAPGWEVPLAKYFGRAKQKAVYTYDFGDDWHHEVLLEKRSAVDAVVAPQCLAGRRHCPPEDCGGPWGYARMLEVLTTPSHPEHDEMAEWIEVDFNSDEFDRSKVVFSDPAKRLSLMLR